MSDAAATLRHVVPGTAEPGWAELCDALADVLDHAADGRPIELDRLKSRVYRLRAGQDGHARSIVVKRYDPWPGESETLQTLEQPPQESHVGATQRGIR